MPLFVRNDSSVYLRGAKDEVTGLYFGATAVGTFEIRTAPFPGGSQVTTGAMNYVTGSNGEFRGDFDSSVSLTKDQTYYVHVVLAQAGIEGDWEEAFVASVRTGRRPKG